MGYTHYFPNNKTATDPQWKKITGAFKKVLAAKPEGVEVWGEDFEDKSSKPVVDNMKIHFNGGHETMVLNRISTGEFDFCKTNEMPYDVVVVALLVIASHFAPKVWDIESDGRKKDWENGLALAIKATGIKTLKIPPTIRA